MQRTVFSTPILTSLLRVLAKLLLKLTGWKILGDRPTVDKYVVIGAPHTSNWDFMLMLAAVLVMRLDVRWMGKDSLFPFPFAGFMKWLGGIPIDRSKANTVVSQVVGRFENEESFVLLITPEGTRSKVKRWKTGFYHIAQQADVPVLLAYLDFDKKEAGLHDWCHPSGELEKGMAEIQSFYATKVAKHPEKF